MIDISLPDSDRLCRLADGCYVRERDRDREQSASEFMLIPGSVNLTQGLINKKSYRMQIPECSSGG